MARPGRYHESCGARHACLLASLWHKMYECQHRHVDCMHARGGGEGVQATRSCIGYHRCAMVPRAHQRPVVVLREILVPRKCSREWRSSLQTPKTALRAASS